MDSQLGNTILLQDYQALIRLIEHTLSVQALSRNPWTDTSQKQKKQSAVLFILTYHSVTTKRSAEPCLVLTKRSFRVPQPGDLCCPGGGIRWLDNILSLILRIKGSPLYRWSLWHQHHAILDLNVRQGARLFATALREGWEELRLNPMQIKFLGPLPMQPLIMFQSNIFPLAVEMEAGQALKPNWEVERVVYIPLRRLLEPQRYGQLQLHFDAHIPVKQVNQKQKKKYLCFVHQDEQNHEILWGATFRITYNFLHTVFNFQLSEITSLPVIHKSIDQVYLNGK